MENNAKGLRLPADGAVSDIITTEQTAFAPLPAYLRNFLKDHNNSLNTGLFYLSIGKLPKSELRQEKKGNFRIKLSAVGQQALDSLLADGFTRTEAFSKAALFLFDYPYLRDTYL